MQIHDWNQLESEQLNPLIKRKHIHTQNMTFARLEITKAAVVPEHHHVHEQVATVERGALKFLMEGREEIVRSGESIVIPPNVPHRVEALEDTIVVDVFSPHRDDWVRGDDSYLRK